MKLQEAGRRITHLHHLSLLLYPRPPKKNQMLLLVLKLSLTTLCFAFLLNAYSSSPLFPPSAPGRKGYIVLINTWKRNELLKKSVMHYSTCSGVDLISIVWSEPDAPTNSLYDDLSRMLKPTNSNGSTSVVKIKFNVNKEDNLNNRFKEIVSLKTDAIFSIDDDVIIPCASVEFAFSVWRSAPSTMVGFVPRMHWLHKPGLSNGKQLYQYGGWWSVWWMGTYSMVLSKAAFFHKQYLNLYTNHMPAPIRDYVTKNRNCEDIAMSFLVANVTGAPPIWVKGRIFEIGSIGISSLKGHDLQRSECLNSFASIYGHMPLVATTMKAIDSRKSWLW